MTQAAARNPAPAAGGGWLGRLSAAAWTGDRLPCLAVALLSALVCVPFLTAYVPWDEGIWLSAAARMDAGQTLYRDVFEFLPPLSFLLTHAWTQAAGATLVSAHLLVALTVAGTAALTVLACRRAGASMAAAASCVLAWVVLSQGVWTQLNHHWFTTFFCMAAAWAMLAHVQARGPGISWLWAAGLAVGAAGMVTPTRGALAALACVALAPRRGRAVRDVLHLAAAVAAVPLAVAGYLAAEGVLGEAFQDVILFTAARYASIQPVPYGAWATLQTALVAAVYPGCALAGAAVLLLHPKLPAGGALTGACAAFAAAGFAGSYPRPDVVHLAMGLPLAFPFALRCRGILARRWPKWAGTAPAWCLAFAIMPRLAQYGTQAAVALSHPAVQTAAGPVRFLEGDAGGQGLATRVLQLPGPSRVFFYPYAPLLAVMSGKVQVSRHDIMTPYYTLPGQYEEICAAVMQDADWVVYDHVRSDPAFLKLVFPAMPEGTPLEQRGFEQALASGFAAGERYGDYELRPRTASAAPALCRPVAALPAR